MMRYMRTGILAVIGFACLLAGARDDGQEGIWPEYAKPETTDSTSGKLIELNLKARGGREILENLQTVELTGILTEGRREFNFRALHVRPDKLRFEKEWSHRGYDHLVVEGTDGSSAWRHVAKPEKKLPQSIGGFDRQLLDLLARMPFLLMDTESGSNIFAYRGKERYAGRPAHLIHGWLESGLQIEIHLDAASFHIINLRQPYEIGGTEVLVDCTPMSMKRIDGIWWTTAWKYHLRNGTFRRLTVEEIRTNVPADPGFFKMPPTNERWIRPRR